MGTKVFGSVFGFVLMIIVASSWSSRHSLKASYALLCDIVHEGYYRKGDRLEEWTRHCHDEASRFRSTSQKNTVDAFNDELALLLTSHLHIYTPQENLQMWENESVDNGLRVRQIEDAFIVHDVVPGSSAATAKLHPGDEIKLIDGEAPAVATDFSGTSGQFEIKRSPKAFKVKLQAGVLNEDLSPQLSALRDGSARLRIASFLPQYFDENKWREVSKKLLNYKKVVIDLRENSGGSFPAMLRAASAFFCGPKEIGELSSQVMEKGLMGGSGKVKTLAVQTQVSGEKFFLKDDLTSDSQIQQLEEHPILTLKTFGGYACTKASVTVLVDSGTSSVSEIFAQALAERPQTKVWGVPTAGQVVMARWFDLSALGFMNYSLSLPIATYVTTEGHEMEAEGFTPSKLLFYDLNQSRLGLDTWLEQAISN